MNDLHIDELAKNLTICWSAETSSDPDNWSPTNPGWGQCAVTALIVQDICGGDIVWCSVSLPNGAKISHYFNKLSDELNGVIDLTRSQFPPDATIPPGIPRLNGYSSTRDYVLSFCRTYERYRTLTHSLLRLRGNRCLTECCH